MCLFRYLAVFHDLILLTAVCVHPCFLFFLCLKDKYANLWKTTSLFLFLFSFICPYFAVVALYQRIYAAFLLLCCCCLTSSLLFACLFPAHAVVADLVVHCVSCPLTPPQKGKQTPLLQKKRKKEREDKRQKQKTTRRPTARCLAQREARSQSVLVCVCVCSASSRQRLSLV